MQEGHERGEATTTTPCDFEHARAAKLSSAISRDSNNWEKTMKRSKSKSHVLVLATLFAICPAFPAVAHSWYPRECCRDYDCAPIETLTQLVSLSGGAPQLVVTSKHGKAIVPRNFPVRELRDDRAHVCMQFDEFGDMQVICLFVPPST